MKHAAKYCALAFLSRPRPPAQDLGHLGCVFVFPWGIVSRSSPTHRFAAKAQTAPVVLSTSHTGPDFQVPVRRALADIPSRVTSRHRNRCFRTGHNCVRCSVPSRRSIKRQPSFTVRPQFSPYRSPLICSTAGDSLSSLPQTQTPPATLATAMFSSVSSLPVSYSKPTSSSGKPSGSSSTTIKTGAATNGPVFFP